MSLGRRNFVLALLVLAQPAFARVKLGDQEWLRRFRLFIKAFNEFVEALDDNKLDRGKWRRMQETWDDLDTD
jgi:hypothetical protein